MKSFIIFRPSCTFKAYPDIIFYILDDRVFIQGAAATPLPLVKAMANHGKNNNLSNVEIIHIHTDGPAEYASPEYEGKYKLNTDIILTYHPYPDCVDKRIQHISNIH